MAYEVNYQKQSSRPEWVLYERPCPGGISSIVGIFYLEETARACAKWLEERKHGNDQESDGNH